MNVNRFTTRYHTIYMDLTCVQKLSLKRRKKGLIVIKPELLKVVTAIHCCNSRPTSRQSFLGYFWPNLYCACAQTATRGVQKVRRL